VKKNVPKNLVAVVRSAGEATASAPPTASLTLTRAAKGINRDGFSRLPFSREEAEAIASLVPKGSLLKATDFRASRATATGGELGSYRIVHFATHGLLNGERPELSGLVLSLVDENGKPQDGFLRMHEIYNLHLPAEVVVLSACQTALGKEIKGEGLVGLTRGFMYAGAQRVVASLWQVDDLATAELMKRFYHGMLKEGLRPAAALRAAQLELMKQKRWAAPYFWAAFTAQGEWR
jgi:CHAT domain-containing protein